MQLLVCLTIKTVDKKAITLTVMWATAPLWWSSANTYNKDIWFISDFQERLRWQPRKYGDALLALDIKERLKQVFSVRSCDDNHKEDTTNQKKLYSQDQPRVDNDDPKWTPVARHCLMRTWDLFIQITLTWAVDRN